MRCPSCAAIELDPTRYDPQGMVTCRCGHRAYAGYIAEANALTSRSAWLVERVAAGDPAPATELQRAYAIWPPPAPGSVAAARPIPVAGAPRGAPSSQTLLLGLGALLLVIAGAVFAAVVWDRLGAAGQIGVMLVATGGVCLLAIRLRTPLAGTAEALAVVAGGLAAIDLFAAPLLGLLPKHWISDPTLYPAVASATLGAGLLALYGRFGLRAWSWLGWSAMLLAAALVVPTVASASDSSAWAAAAVAVPALASVAMLAGGTGLVSSASARVEPTIVGACGLFFSATAAASSAMERDALPGALLATAATALAVAICAVLGRARAQSQMVSLGAGALFGITTALVLALPEDPQPVLLAAVVALGGLAVGLVTWWLAGDRLVAIAGACGVWVTWAALRLESDTYDSDLVEYQLALLAALVALVAFAAAWWMPAAGWVAAVLGFVAMLVHPGTPPDPIEAVTLPFAGLLLAAGLLWRRHGPTPSFQWLGPAVAVALIPSAFAAWTAPWALDITHLTTGAHLVRLAMVLTAGVLAVVMGARLRLAGLLVPAAIALVVLASAQIWSGLANLPRWVALAIAGTLLVVAGARIEQLRGQGRRAAGWAQGLE